MVIATSISTVCIEEAPAKDIRAGGDKTGAGWTKRTILIANVGIEIKHGGMVIATSISTAGRQNPDTIYIVIGAASYKIVVWPV